MSVYTSSAQFYDLIYRWKDYVAEVDTLRGWMAQYTPGANTLLDVACGTGAHLRYLHEQYACTGVDISPELLAAARERLPEVEFHQGDMRAFDLGRTFDVVTCLFSAIGYMTTEADLRAATATMARHVAPGGLLIIEPWFYPEQFHDGHISANFIDEPHVKLARMNVGRVEGTLSIMDMQHLVVTDDGGDVQHFVERHEMGLFTHEQYAGAIAVTGLTPIYDKQGLMGRGLYMGSRAV